MDKLYRMNDSFLYWFISFLKTTELIKEKLSVGKKLIILFKLYLLLLLFSFLINSFSIFINYKPLPIRDSIEFTTSNVYLIIIFFIITPIHEEFTFRLFLAKYGQSRFIISFSLLISYAFYWLLNLVFTFPVIITKQVTHYIFLVLFALLLFYVFNLLIRLINTDKLHKFWDKNMLFIFYTISLVFTLSHYKGTLLESGGVVAEIIYLMPIFLLSLILGFVRMNFGILYSVIFHLIFNLPNTLFRIAMT